MEGGSRGREVLSDHKAHPQPPPWDARRWGPLGIDAPNNLARAGWEYLPLFVLFASQQRDARDACFAAETESAPADAGPEHASPKRQEIDTA